MRDIDQLSKNLLCFGEMCLTTTYSRSKDVYAISHCYGPLLHHSMPHAPEQSQEQVQQMYNLQEVYVIHISNRTEELQ